MNIILFIVCILILLLVYVFSKKCENFSVIKIPLIMYKTGPENTPSKKILKLFKENENQLNVKIVYFNDEDCLNFIQKIGGNTLQAYNSLIPNAYKADLWRYNVLYYNGGIYGDLTQHFIKPYDINQGNIDMVFVKDINGRDIQISFMATVKNNNFFKYLIDNICDDIIKKKIGMGSLDITGPMACGRYFKKFFNVSTLPDGINYLKGLDNKKYKVKIDLQQYPGYFYKNNKKEKIAITKTKWHNDMITSKGKQEKYWILYNKQKIFN